MTKIYTLRNNNGMEVEVTNYGARIVRLVFAGRDVVMGFDNLEDYLPENHQTDFGALIGRYANRLAGGLITIDGKTIQLPQNNGQNCLHGGPNGWQYALFEVVEASERELRMRLKSEDGDNCFPGNVEAEVVYSIDDENALRIDYRAESDRTTVINLTNHSYFNLDGTDGRSEVTTVHNHWLQIDADLYTPVDSEMIPLEAHAEVTGSPFDFRKGKRIGEEIDADDEQLRTGLGYDHNFVLNTRGDASRPCARLESMENGIGMEIYTTAPGMQVYTGNFLDGVKGKGGTVYGRQGAVCLETQQYPDSPNRNWPESTGYLYKDKPFRSSTTFKFYRHD